jgi:hypothetical protein
MSKSLTLGKTKNIQERKYNHSNIYVVSITQTLSHDLIKTDEITIFKASETEGIVAGEYKKAKISFSIQHTNTYYIKLKNQQTGHKLITLK